jgi:H/ACA ribonucleoprotein complex subunit 4
MWLIKSEEKIDEKLGKRPEDRTVEELIKSSVVIVDKHQGPTSHQITDWVKKMFELKKAGHSGTLDPGVSGVLPVALENGTKIMPMLVGLDKTYVGIMHIHQEVDEKVLREKVSHFIGKIKQLPPVKSAVARKIREREIHFFDLIEIEGKDVLFKVGCEAGTYIRKLVHDLGMSLGTGAHMAELRRVEVGEFIEKNSHSLVSIKDAYEFWKEGDEKPIRNILIPVERAIEKNKKIFVKDSAISTITNGAPVYPNGITRIQEGIEAGELIGIFSLKDELVAIGIAKMPSEEMMKRKKGIAVRTDRVIMEKGIYPTRSGD